MNQPSSLYSLGWWRAGLWCARLFPPALLMPVARCLARLYWLLAPHRRKVLIRNLLPAVNGDSAAARRTARRLMGNFGTKLVDLFRYESGRNISDLFGESTGWEHLLKARDQKRGVLVVTCHLGNWELGGPWLTRKGMSLQVITLAEPGVDFTALRQQSRARWNIDTLVIGSDPFAIVDVIRRLENGAMVALLVDRPPAGSAMKVNLFGQPFAASVAAAELARASGCAIVPVYLPRAGDNYEAHVLPEVEYDRSALRDRAASRELTQRIMTAFEPVLRERLDQWYHFVPIWPENEHDIS
ncbi:MAG TPA: lysophospholipid acyltransferase family protein [Verrucomicrobiae bacterium]|nr:lysophospholipid acyltransferase family protein [Verrucomicrobiae bacterium]